MKSVLIISDNESLVLHLKFVVEEEKLGKLAKFEFFYSVSNKSPSRLSGLGMSPINLKDEATCEAVIKKYDLVLSLHCKQIFPPRLVNSLRCINFHPGFNPYNKGWYPQVFSIINKKLAGTTVHIMDDEVDNGPIIYQERVDIQPSDTSLDVYGKIIQVEKMLISKHLSNLVNENYTFSRASDNGNYNSIADFRSLCKLNLSDVGTLGDHIDLLRALSHADFNNAYFIANGERVYVKLLLKRA